MLKLPKDLVADPRHAAVGELLETNCAPLWESARLSVATVPLTKGLAQVLREALQTGHAAQGLEVITAKLAAEQKGLDAVQEKTPQAPSSPRVSRLLFVAGDGSKRFYRDTESLLLRHAQRLMVCRIDVPGEELGEALFGTPRLVRSVLVFDKKVVTRALLSLLPS